MDTTVNSDSYTKCVSNCKTSFDKEGPLVACINGCATVNTPPKAVTAEGDDRVGEEILRLEDVLRRLKAAVR